MSHDYLLYLWILFGRTWIRVCSPIITFRRPYLISSLAHFCKLRPYDILPYVHGLFFMEIQNDSLCELVDGFDNKHNFRLIQSALWMSYCVHDDMINKRLQVQTNRCITWDLLTVDQYNASIGSQP